MGLVAPWHVGSSQARARTRVPCIGRHILNHCATREAPDTLLTKVHGLLKFTLCVVHSVGFDRCMMTCIHHHGVTQSSFTVLKSPVPSGDIFDCHNQAGVAGIQWVEARDAARYSAVRKPVP